MSSFQQSALRLRPRTFEEVVGQDTVVKVLKNSVRQKRVGNSYVFVGPSGVGKTTLARILAAGLNCQEKLIPCGKCESCVDIAEGRGEYVIEVDAASDRGVSMVEGLHDTVSYLLPDNAWRVFILDEAHQLSNKAWGAFLKIIEEPPARNVFVFVTTEDGKIPATVRTRSAVFAFKPVPPPVILKYISGLNLDVDESVLQLVSRRAEGSLREALQVVDQLSLLGERVTLATAEELLGTNEELSRVFADALMEQTAAAFVSALDSGFKKGLTVDQMASIVADLSRDFYLVRTGYTGWLRSGLSRGGIRANTSDLSDSYLASLFLEVSEFMSRFLKTRLGLEAMYVKVLQTGRGQ